MSQPRDGEDITLIIPRTQPPIIQLLGLSRTRTMECKWPIFSTHKDKEGVIGKDTMQVTKPGIKQVTNKAILQDTALVITVDIKKLAAGVAAGAVVGGGTTYIISNNNYDLSNNEGDRGSDDGWYSDNDNPNMENQGFRSDWDGDDDQGVDNPFETGDYDRDDYNGGDYTGAGYAGGGYIGGDYTGGNAGNSGGQNASECCGRLLQL
ncbi:hypothetical protein B0T10DRAFT_569047 [Thelonectria olida]|uniref:Uncharacterized protein n=1 Tax=Thelonectria olida TaxID=1576542 RepID=A0A9P8VRL7_9HYPO|nr:hypothetical protein B0T10DRAFT_569047 [Thelonectria olida]